MVRSRCLHIIATMDNQVNYSDGNKPAQSLGTLQQFTSDQDPRVRTAALQALVSIVKDKIRVEFHYTCSILF